MGLFSDLQKKTPETKGEVREEGLSSLTDLQVLEKIDQYNNEIKLSVTIANLNNLKQCIAEFDKRFAAIPLSKRGSISQDWSFLKVQVTNVERLMNLAPQAVGSICDQITSYLSKLYTELCK